MGGRRGCWRNSTSSTPTAAAIPSPATVPGRPVSVPILAADLYAGETYDARLELAGWDRPGFADPDVAAGAGRHATEPADPSGAGSARPTHGRRSRRRRSPGRSPACTWSISGGISPAGCDFGSSAPAGTKITMRFGEMLNRGRHRLPRQSSRRPRHRLLYLQRGRRGGLGAAIHLSWIPICRGGRAARAARTQDVHRDHRRVGLAAYGLVRLLQRHHDPYGGQYAVYDPGQPRRRSHRLPAARRADGVDGLSRSGGQHALRAGRRQPADEVDGRHRRRTPDGRQFLDDCSRRPSFRLVAGMGRQQRPHSLDHVPTCTTTRGSAGGTIAKWPATSITINGIPPPWSVRTWDLATGWRRTRLPPSSSSPPPCSPTVRGACRSWPGPWAKRTTPPAIGSCSRKSARRSRRSSSIPTAQSAPTRRAGMPWRWPTTCSTASRSAGRRSHLVAAIDARDGHLSTGMVTTHLLLPALSKVGRTDAAYRLFAQTTYPSWGYFLKLGATSMWERWDGKTEKGFYEPAMNSFNHANLGTCTEWFYRTVLGIDCQGPGFQRIIIKPIPGGGLTWAKGHYDSPHGRIASRLVVGRPWLRSERRHPGQHHGPGLHSGRRRCGSPGERPAGRSVRRRDVRPSGGRQCRFQRRIGNLRLPRPAGTVIADVRARMPAPPVIPANLSDRVRRQSALRPPVATLFYQSIVLRCMPLLGVFVLDLRCRRGRHIFCSTEKRMCDLVSIRTSA